MGNQGNKPATTKLDRVNSGTPNTPTSARGNPNGMFSDDVLYTQDSGKVGIEDFELLKVIGKGNFAKVMQVRKKDTGRIYAMKILDKEKLIARDQLEHTRTERRVLQLLRHPFLVNLVYAFQTVDKLYMVIDFVNGGELFFHLKRDKRFKESRARFYACEILLALEHLHKHDVIYRDLKPENILIDRFGHVAVTDFGLAKELVKDNAKTHTFCGTPEYLAPEVLLSQGHGKPVDWWSFGTLLFEMLVGIPPFYSENVQEMYEMILYSDLYFPDFVSVEASDLLARLLERNPAKRLGSGPTGVEEIKSHPFFKGINWETFYNKGYPAPFTPSIKSDEDTSNFDTEFTREAPTLSKKDESMLGESVQKVFKGFSYVPDDGHI